MLISKIQHKVNFKSGIAIKKPDMNEHIMLEIFHSNIVCREVIYKIIKILIQIKVVRYK